MKFNFHLNNPRVPKTLPKTLILSLVWLSLFLVSNKILAGEVSGQIKVQRRAGLNGWSPISDRSGVVVFITGFDEATAKDKPKIYLDQVNKAFVPRAMAVTVGDTVIFRNKDEVFHNTWSVSPTKSFDLGQYKEPVEKTVLFDKPGMVSIFCNIHPKMMASVLILKNNKYVVTDPSGDYRITGIPAGHRQIRIWAEGADPIVKDIEVTGTSSEKIDFTVNGNQQSEDHPNKEGKSYKNAPSSY